MDSRMTKDIRYLKGIGEAKGKLYRKLGVETIEDLLFYFPRDYENRGEPVKIRDIMPGQLVSFVGRIDEIFEYRAKTGRLVTKTTAYDDTGSIKITFFNNKYIKNTLKQETDYLFYGRVEGNFITKEMTSPVYEKYVQEEAKKIVPLYSLTGGLSQKQLQKDIKQAALIGLNEITEFMPEQIRQEYNLLSLKDAISQIHFPESFEECERAKCRLCFDEIFLLQILLIHIKNTRQEQTGVAMDKRVDMSPFDQSLPFALTKAQERSIREILDDLKTDRPANRLIQGDVGSGKTIVCAAGIYFSKCNGYQCAMMAPTEILAKQHYHNLNELFAPLGFKTALLTSSTPKKQKDGILEALESGEIDLVIGTHAILNDEVRFNRLGLVITDEQHRFGVSQRAVLSNKVEGVNVLVMSATPIPRTLSLIIYGDLDLSVIDELPPGRKTVDTYLVDESMRIRIERFIDKQLKMGAQGYIVCPLIEENEKTSGYSVEEYKKNLPPYLLKNYKIEIIHGRMKSEQKDKIMNEFKNGEIQLLISTTVIEVGIDVSNATFMIVEDAYRFGLSQLHQLRGRVGRGEKKSYCIMFGGDKGGEKTRERLNVLCKTNDGFVIAKEDLRLRGPGDFLGQRQHGLPDLKIADVFGDTETIYQTREAAINLLSQDASLKNEENQILKMKIREMRNKNRKNVLN